MAATYKNLRILGIELWLFLADWLVTPLLRQVGVLQRHCGVAGGKLVGVLLVACVLWLTDMSRCSCE